MEELRYENGAVRGVTRTSEDGWTFTATLQVGDRAKIRIQENDGKSAFDILNVDERVAVIKILANGLTLDQLRDALPTELFTTEWGLRTTDNWPDNEIIGQPEGGILATRSDAEAGLADLVEKFEDPAAEIVRRETTSWLRG